MSNKPIVREVSQDWHTNISYAEDGTIVEIVLIDAKKEGLLPVEFKKVAYESVFSCGSSSMRNNLAKFKFSLFKNCIGNGTNQTNLVVNIKSKKIDFYI